VRKCEKLTSTGVINVLKWLLKYREGLPPQFRFEGCILLADSLLAHLADVGLLVE